jgi:hypothetical protein
MWRLYNASEALQQFDQARRFCDQASRRFPSDYRFVNCSLRIMYLPGSAADVDRAWELLSRLDTLTPPPDREFEMVRGPPNTPPTRFQKSRPEVAVRARSPGTVLRPMKISVGAPRPYGSQPSCSTRPVYGSMRRCEHARRRAPRLRHRAARRRPAA